MKKILLIFFINIFNYSISFALPNCENSELYNWNNCQGTHTFINGHLAYKNGKFNEEKKGMRLKFSR